MADIDKTLKYYNENAQSFASGTVSVKFTKVQDKFLEKLNPDAYILDFGCGAGRDTKYFLSRGYQVDAVDGSEQLCRIASEYTEIKVRQILVQELDETEKYDEWKWSKEWEDYTCNQVNGEIQLFDDCEDKLFLGYIFAMSGEYEHIDSIQYSIHNFDEEEDRNFDEIEEEVLEKFSRLQEIGVIEDEDKFAPDYKLIIFDVFRQEIKHEGDN